MISAADMLLTAADKNENYIAVKDEKSQITYKELLNSAYELANDINDLISGKGNPIIIITSKTIESLIAIWGVVCSGNYYVAVDYKTPEVRRNNIIKQVKPKIIIYSDKISNTVIDDKIMILQSQRSLFNYSIESIKKKIDKIHIIEDDPLYMVFTSGSTGEPKAIIKSHKSILSFVESFVSEFGLKSDKHEIFGNQASFDFDVSAKDIYVSVRICATICLIPNNCFLMPKKLSIYLKENRISVLIWAASAIKYAYKFKCFRYVIPESLDKVFFSGESMPTECINYWRHCLPMTTFVNLYAPSEVTGNCLYHIVNDEIYGGILPLEKVLPNVDVMILNDDNNPINDGEKGEIYVRGSFLASGYYNSFEQTNSRFIQNPMNTHFPDIVYRTGDYVYKKGKHYYFAGRVDNQIKHMGHRIELEEIETSCVKCGFDMDMCAVYDSDAEKIILLTDNTDITYELLVEKLKQIVPKYMIPHELVKIAAIPYTKRGKIDRTKVKSVYEEKYRNV